MNVVSEMTEFFTAVHVPVNEKKRLQRIFEMVRMEEREACAKIADARAERATACEQQIIADAKTDRGYAQGMAPSMVVMAHGEAKMAKEIAAEIRDGKK